MAYIHPNGPDNYPGANITLASLFATILMFAVGWALWYWTVCLPRSGGIYVFVSRTFGSGAGFIVSFVETMCWIWLSGLAGVLVATVGLAPLFSFLARTMGDSRFSFLAQLMNKAGAQFFFGALLIMSSGVLLALGMRRFFQVQKVMFLIAVAETIVTNIWLLGSHTHQEVVARFSKLTPSLGPGPPKIIW